MGFAGAWLVGLLALSGGEIGGEIAQRIDWEAGEGCPSQAAVLEATSAYLGAALPAFSRAVIVQARVEAGPAGYRLRLAIAVDDMREDHELRAVDCDQLGREAALLIASAVDPFALGPRPPATRQLLMRPVVVQRPRARVRPPDVPTPVSEPGTSPQPSPALAGPVAPVAVERPKPPRRPSRHLVTGTLGMDGAGLVGLFPQIGGGLELEGGLHRGLFRWQVGAAGWFGGRFRAPASSFGADLWAASGSTGLCVAPGRARVRFAACAVAGVGAITANSVNTERARRIVRPWAFVGPDLRVTWTPRARLGLFVGIAALPALVRPGWSVSNPEASFRVPPVAGVLRVGLELGELGGR
ncbi:MAG: hypothetical protein R6X02_20780 [Enhygromyxa sp.]